MNKKRYLVIIGIVVVLALVSFLVYTRVARRQLAITSLKASATWVVPSGTLNVTCNATAPQGDVLSYNWSASGGRITGEGATVDWIAPYSRGSYNVTVTVLDDRGGNVTGHVTIIVRINSVPTIASLVANATWTTPSGNLQVVCDASDPNGDNLTYEWSATGGNISGTGAAVNWTAPQEVGTYNITVVVKNGYGGEDTAFVPLSVALGTPPTIENLIVKGNGNTYLKPDGVAGCDYEVYQTKSYNITCNALGTGTLVFNWSCTAGNISGEGSNITWTAPSTPNSTSIKATVTVMVSDVTNNSVAKNIVFYVSYCTCPF